MSSPAEWTVRDLAELAGTTVRTIHYYISEGLLPPPVGATRSATYSPAHLARLQLIAALRDEGLALANIRQRLAPLTDEQAVEVAGELNAYLRQPANAQLTTLGLIEAVLASKTMTADVQYDMADSPSAIEFASIETVARRSVEEPPAPPPPPQGSASEYLKQVLGNRPPARPSAAVSRPRSSPRKPIDSDQPEAWYHLRIADGVELRVREDRYRETKGRLRAVVDTLRTTLNRYGLGDPKDGT